jgi:hypothetical protein
MLEYGMHFEVLSQPGFKAWSRQLQSTCQANPDSL